MRQAPTATTMYFGLSDGSGSGANPLNPRDTRVRTSHSGVCGRGTPYGAAAYGAFAHDRRGTQRNVLQKCPLWLCLGRTGESGLKMYGKYTHT